VAVLRKVRESCKIQEQLNREVDDDEKVARRHSIVTMTRSAGQSRQSETPTMVFQIHVSSRFLTSPQISQHQPDKDNKHTDSRPEYPLILLRPPLHHLDRISTNPKRIRNTVQLLLRTLEHLSLLSQITQHSPPSLQKLIQLCIRPTHKTLLPHRMLFPPIIRRTRPKRTRPRRTRSKHTPLRPRRYRSIRIRILRRARLMRPPSQQLRPIIHRLALGKLFPHAIKLVAVVCELGAEVLDSDLGLFGFFGDGFLGCEGGVFVDCAGEGG